MQRTVHPHSRGVYSVVGAGVVFMFRFIPTRVGYTTASRRKKQRITVHPHSRGVYDCPVCYDTVHIRFIPTRVGYTPRIFAIAIASHGSSPLAWGIRYMLHEFGRIISGSSPLAWGIRFLSLFCFRPSAVHPHSRGVYYCPKINFVII